MLVLGGWLLHSRLWFCCAALYVREPETSNFKTQNKKGGDLMRS